MEDSSRRRTREIARDVLVEAFGASATPFVPVPFVDDFLHERLLRRVAVKVLQRHGLDANELPRDVVAAYVRAGARPLASSIAIGAARFIVRKVAIVLDVKKSYDVFGQAIAFALGLDIVATEGWLDPKSVDGVGAALHRALEIVSSGALEGLGRAGREAYASGGGVSQLAEALGVEVEKTRAQLYGVLRGELGSPSSRVMRSS
jgi:hypothetical protein